MGNQNGSTVGNPAAIAAATAATSLITPENLKWLLILGGAGAGIYFLYKEAKDQRSKSAGHEFGEDVNAAAAVGLLNAFNPSGFRMAIRADGTNDDMVFHWAAQITDFKRTSQIYQRLTKGRSLADDLQAELDPAELGKFNSILRGGASSSSSSNTTRVRANDKPSIALLTKARKSPTSRMKPNVSKPENRGKGAITSGALNIRTDPVATSQTLILKAPKSTFVGMFTGRYYRDQKGITYAELAYRLTANSHTRYVYAWEKLLKVREMKDVFAAIRSKRVKVPFVS